MHRVPHRMMYLNNSNACADGSRLSGDTFQAAELRELCDLNTLHLESGSFIEESLAKGTQHGRALSAQMQGNPGYLHVVIEHQSKPDKKWPSHDALFCSRHALQTRKG